MLKDLEKLKRLLDEEPRISIHQREIESIKNPDGIKVTESISFDIKETISFTPYYSRISENDSYLRHISLQMWGWAIVLNDDGSWFWEDTSGG